MQSLMQIGQNPKEEFEKVGFACDDLANNLSGGVGVIGKNTLAKVIAPPAGGYM